MKVVWRLETATVRQVYETMLEHRKIAYTTVMTMMNILEQKGYLKKRQDDRAYVYTPSRPEKQVIRSMVREFVDRVFNGSAEPLLVAPGGGSASGRQGSGRDPQDASERTPNDRCPGSRQSPRLVGAGRAAGRGCRTGLADADASSRPPDFLAGDFGHRSAVAGGRALASTDDRGHRIGVGRDRRRSGGRRPAVRVPLHMETRILPAVDRGGHRACASCGLARAWFVYDVIAWMRA